MTFVSDNVLIKTVRSIEEIGEEAWSRAVQAAPGEADNPFLTYGFLHSLEVSGSVGEQTGWVPFHLVMADGDGQTLGLAPQYLKTHSYGEYVFDHAWADAYERAGGRYYPKLQISIPFTPASGRRFLVPPGPDREARERALALGATKVAEEAGVSSLHTTFIDKDSATRLARINDGSVFLKRTDQQFHWENRDYNSFDGFLSDLASRKRKNIRKERAQALSDGVTIRWLKGAEITEAHWDAFFDFYMDTGARKWGTPYLTREFFSEAGTRMGDKVLLFLCERNGTPIGGALNFVGSDTLYGRYWGAREHQSCLHFEACYYQAIDYAIEHKLRFVEAGAQGPHKLARGYLPVTTMSLHWVRDPGFREAIARYLEVEREDVDRANAMLAAHGPFKKS
ncbi:MAG: GNAT family N-acetyltransferase [Pseudomonadota bacterium]